MKGGTPALDPGRTGVEEEVLAREHGKRDPSTTSGTNGRNLETHRTKKQNTTNIQKTRSRNSNTIRYNITTAYMIGHTELGFQMAQGPHS